MATRLTHGHLQVTSNADPVELRLRLESHQRMLARWEGKVARQLEKIVTLQRGGRGGSAASLLATPLMGQASALSGKLCIDACLDMNVNSALSGGAVYLCLSLQELCRVRRGVQ